ncbi:hypothetical protein FHW69_003826 [Luteibacter sp. Sphag1AF]|nr:hypothetical protein [Luteibacter sp. Sphag1AF]
MHIFGARQLGPRRVTGATRWLGSDLDMEAEPLVIQEC